MPRSVLTRAERRRLWELIERHVDAEITKDLNSDSVISADVQRAAEQARRQLTSYINQL